MIFLPIERALAIHMHRALHLLTHADCLSGYSVSSAEYISLVTGGDMANMKILQPSRAPDCVINCHRRQLDAIFR